MPDLWTEEPLSFLYDGKPFRECERDVRVNDAEEVRTVEYRLPDGLLVTHAARRYEAYGAYEWVTYFENTSDRISGILSELNDCDIRLPFPFDERGPLGYMPSDKAASIYNPFGSTWNRNEFSCTPQAIYPGEEKRFSASGGRSSEKNAPFFDIHRQNAGVMFAIGWTGQWACSITRDDTDIRIRTGIEEVCFRLYPGEKIRTSSIVVMPYECAQNDAHNRFRRLIKEHFSLIGQEGRDQEGPLSHTFWGALSSDNMIDVIHKMTAYDLGFEYVWIDAGWYGYSTETSFNAFEGDWAKHTGNWNVNTFCHPDGLKEVSKAIADGGMKFMLWVEPERCLRTTDIAEKHPEWFLKRDGDVNCLMDLGNPEALAYAIDLLSGLIQDLHISCYRQDFNMEPLAFWRDSDEPDRKGIHEIKHMMGLYTFWDTLLERFPHLMIDNCASGGRRIDIETLRRSIPLWRSDYQCWLDADPETNQSHLSSISWWIPYSGTGNGNVLGDIYHTRSSYSPALVMKCWGHDAFRKFNETDAEWMKAIAAEYKRVRPYLTCDYYPLILSPMDDSNWSVSQYNRPENGDGVILAFRRPKSPCDRAVLPLEGLEPSATYVFNDADTGLSFERSGAELQASPLSLVLPEPRSSKILFYQTKKPASF